MEWFADELHQIARDVELVLKQINVPPMMNVREKLKQEMAHKCYLCRKGFTTDDPKVLEHCHITGKYRGAAHESCNLKARKRYVLPCFFHNLEGYDAHCIIRDVFNRIPGRSGVLAKNPERYISFSLQPTGSKLRIQFLDSLKFLPCSLQTLATTLPAEEKQLLKRRHPEHFTLLTQKLSFPYEYCSSMDILEQTELPSPEGFFSSLTSECISLEDYVRVKEVWNKMKIKNLGELNDLG